MKSNLLPISTLVLVCATVCAAEVKVSSPDGKSVIAVTDAGGLSYSVFLDSREVVAKSRFGIIADGVDLGTNVTLKESSSHRIRQTYSIFGGHSQANNDCREATFSVHTAGDESYELDVRAYNDRGFRNH